MAKRKTTNADDPATAYARSVQSGETIASRLVRLACDRHLRDLDQQREKGLVWRPEKAQDAIDFFEKVLCLPDVGSASDDEGALVGSPFLLRPFQKFIVGNLFGWYRTSGQRRFRVAYVETGKGSGKTPLAAGIALYGLVLDGGKGAQIFAAAVTEKQAKLAWTDAENMVLASPELNGKQGGIVDLKVNNLAVLGTGAFFRPVSSEKRGLDGKRVYIAIIDEVHEHPDANVVDKMRAGTKGRKNALIFQITNSGYDRKSVCWREHEYSRQLLQRTLHNESRFAFVCHLDACETCYAAGNIQPDDKCKQCDQWDVEGPHWLKANPCLGYSLPWEYLREQVEEAKGMPTKQNIVRRLNFCQWTDQHTVAIGADAWAACGEEPLSWGDYKGRTAYLGLDLANTTDIAAALWLFPGDDGELDVIPRFWVPEEGIRLRSQRDHVPYEEWEKAGYITATEGNVIDYDAIRQELNEYADDVVLKEAGFDPWNATQLATQLMGDGFTMVAVRQGYKTMSEPTKQLMALVTSKKLRHGNHPVLRWMAANLVLRQDPVGNVAPDKAKASEKIDGIVALIIGLSRLIVQPSGDDTSVYEERGVITL
jgi:phage terminase large subunit-like protein